MFLQVPRIPGLKDTLHLGSHLRGGIYHISMILEIKDRSLKQVTPNSELHKRK